MTPMELVSRIFISEPLLDNIPDWRLLQANPSPWLRGPTLEIPGDHSYIFSMGKGRTQQVPVRGGSAHLAD